MLVGWHRVCNTPRLPCPVSVLRQNPHGLKLYALAALLNILYSSLCSPYLIYAVRYVIDGVMIFLAEKLYLTVVSRRWIWATTDQALPLQSLLALVAMADASVAGGQRAKVFIAVGVGPGGHQPVIRDRIIHRATSST